MIKLFKKIWNLIKSLFGGKKEGLTTPPPTTPTPINPKGFFYELTPVFISDQIFYSEKYFQRIFNIGERVVDGVGCIYEITKIVNEQPMNAEIILEIEETLLK